MVGLGIAIKNQIYLEEIPEEWVSPFLFETVWVAGGKIDSEIYSKQEIMKNGI